MMDALRFIFSSFWIWLGFTTLRMDGAPSRLRTRPKQMSQMPSAHPKVRPTMSDFFRIIF